MSYFTCFKWIKHIFKRNIFEKYKEINEEQINEQVNVQVNEQENEQVNIQVNVQVNSQSSEQLNEQVNNQVNKQVNEQLRVYYFDNVMATMQNCQPLKKLRYYKFATRTTRQTWKLDLIWPSGNYFTPDNIYFTIPKNSNYKPGLDDVAFVSDVLDYLQENTKQVSERILMYENGNGQNINCVGGTYITSVHNITVSIFARQSKNNLYLLMNINL